MRNNTGIVNVPLLRLKERPLEEVQTVDEVLYGMEVLIREKTAKGSWAAVETAYGYQGYVKTEGLECHEWSIRKWPSMWCVPHPQMCMRCPDTKIRFYLRFLKAAS